MPVRRKNRAVVDLPALLVLTDRGQAGRRGLVPTVAAAVEGGARAVVLREKDLSAQARAGLARSLLEVLDPVGGMLLLAGSDADLAGAVGANGLHLAASDPRPAGGHELLVGRSCHGSDELARAVEEDLDFALVSPVFPSASKPGYGPALGTKGLARLVAHTSVPVLALGGVTPASAGACLGVGAVGVAVMGAIMGADDPAQVTSAFLTALAVDARTAGSAP
ncbi:MAG: thiamine phosphate synthase [Acidimicrobiales bacterium]